MSMYEILLLIRTMEAKIGNNARIEFASCFGDNFLRIKCFWLTNGDKLMYHRTWPLEALAAIDKWTNQLEIDGFVFDCQKEYMIYQTKKH